MASKTFRVHRYQVYLGSKLLIAVAGGEAPAQALIHCVGHEKSESFDVIFLGSEAGSGAWPNQTELSDARTMGRIFAPATQYMWYLDLLRNESPVYADVDAANPNLNRLWCNEPVGEGEIPHSALHHRS